MTKILLTLTLAIFGLNAFADKVEGKAADVESFAPASESPKPADTQEQLTVREETADLQTDAGHCSLACHPAFTVFQKTNLAHLDPSKSK